MMTHSIQLFRALVIAVMLALPLAGVRAESIVSVATQAELELRIKEARADNVPVTFDCDGIIVLTNTIVLTNSSLLETNIEDGEIEMEEVVIDATGRFIAFSGSSGTNTTNSVRLFSVGSGVALTFVNIGFFDGVSTNGGALFIDRNAQVLAVECVFSNNIALGSNGVSGASASTNSTPSRADNGRGGSIGRNAAGGAIYNLGSAQFDRCAFLTNGVFAGNGGQGGNGGNGVVSGGNGGGGGRGGIAYGGAIYNARQLTATNCSFNLNFAVGGSGGEGGIPGTGSFAGYDGRGGSGGGAAGAAVFNDRTSESVFIDSTFALNGATSGSSADAGGSTGRGKRGNDGPASAGGALANYGTNLLINCTFFANVATAGNGGTGASGSIIGGRGGNGGTAWGGNVFNGGRGKRSRSEMIALNCTISDGGAVPGTNGVGGSGQFPSKIGSRGVSRGSNLANSNGVVYLTNCIIAYANPGTNIFGKLTKPDYNLSSDRSFKFKPALSNLFNIDPKLDILRANGGFVETIELLEGSKAIDAGTTNNYVIAADARGISRPVGGRIDIGAYESGVYLGAPRITTQPVSQLVREDGSVTFTVIAQGDAPLLYQWRKGSGDSAEAIDDATESSFTIFPATDDDGGTYDVVVSNNSGSVASSNVTLTVVHAPTIVEDLENLSVDRGANFFLSVVAEGDPTLTYQWYTNDVRVPGALLSTFTVLNAQVDGVRYFVRVCNPYGCAESSEATVSLTNSLPYIVVQPVNRVVAISNNTSFTVIAGGARPLSYQWQHDGTNVPNATGPTLNIVNAQTNNAGTYRVRVSNAFNVGGVFSTNVTLIVQTEKPTIDTEPVSIVRIAGQTAEFTVGAGGSAPFTYQWYFNTNTALAGGTNATLTLTNAQAANVGSYHVIVANTLGTATSAPVTLNINSSLPIISSQPVSTNVYPGDTATFIVRAGGTDPLRYQWYFNDAPILNGIAATLNVVNANATNAGTYHVIITNVLGSATSGPVTLTILAGSAANITVEPVSVTSTVGSTATFSVTAVGNKPMYYQWYFNNVPIGTLTNIIQNGVLSPSGSRVFITNTLAGSSLTITNNRLADEGEYRVVVTNSLGGDASVTANLVLQTPTAPVIQTQPMSTGIYSGDTAAFSVSANGSGFLRYQWYFNNNPISGATSTTLSITNAQSINAGNYHVVVTNNVGTDTSLTATLTVSNSTPAITTQPVDVQTNIGTPVNFSVATSGRPSLLYQWYFNDVPVGSLTNVNQSVINPISGSQVFITNTSAGSTLTIATNKLADEGEYRVVVTNGSGSDASAPANLILQTPVAPVIQTDPVSASIYSGETATFSFTASGTGFLRYQWYFNNNPILGASAATYSITNAQSANAGTYHVTVTNIAGITTSSPATLNVSDSAPVITAHPADIAANRGDNVTFTVTVVGSKPMTYQWYHFGIAYVNGEPSIISTNLLANGTNATLSLIDVQPVNQGVYQVAITNTVGGTLSLENTLTVP